MPRNASKTLAVGDGSTLSMSWNDDKTTSHVQTSNNGSNRLKRDELTIALGSLIAASHDDTG